MLNITGNYTLLCCRVSNSTDVYHYKNIYPHVRQQKLRFVQKHVNFFVLPNKTCFQLQRHHMIPRAGITLFNPLVLIVDVSTNIDYWLEKLKSKSFPIDSLYHLLFIVKKFPLFILSVEFPVIHIILFLRYRSMTMWLTQDSF